MKVVLPERPRARIEMLPLIDIVFLLLVFFLYAMLSMAVHKGLPVDLPTSEGAEIDKESILSVTVKQDDKSTAALIYVDEEEVGLVGLTDLLRQKAAEMRKDRTEEPGVLLFADRMIDYQKLFNVLDRINQAGLSRISLQADADAAIAQ